MPSFLLVPAGLGLTVRYPLRKAPGILSPIFEISRAKAAHGAGGRLAKQADTKPRTNPAAGATP